MFILCNGTCPKREMYRRLCRTLDYLRRTTSIKYDTSNNHTMQYMYTHRDCVQTSSCNWNCNWVHAKILATNKKKPATAQVRPGKKRNSFFSKSDEHLFLKEIAKKSQRLISTVANQAITSFICVLVLFVVVVRLWTEMRNKMDGKTFRIIVNA